ncbi:hypothetical protein FACS1894184_04810 [Clostridia bacterium]|nr:hypothetical protein FACS1894184_04810 [Clostridia bacterium]
MPTKRKRARVNIGYDADGKTMYKWASALTKKALKDEVKRIQVEFTPVDALLMPPQVGAIATPLAVIEPAKIVSVTAPVTASVAAPIISRTAPTFREYASNWFDLYKKSTIREKTQDTYTNAMNAHLFPEFGSTAIDAIGSDDLQRLIIRYANVSSSLIDQIVMTVRQVFRAAHDDGLITMNPTLKMNPPEGKEGERHPLSIALTLELLHDAPEHRYGLLPIVLLYSGLRCGEALGLRWDDLSDGLIHVTRSVSFDENSGSPIIGPTKTKAGVRNIPIFPELSESLSKPSEGFIFHGRTKDKPMCQSTFMRHWYDLKEGVPTLLGVTPHILRYTYLKLLRRMGVDPATQQYLMGHEDCSTTANFYTEIEREDIEEARQKMSGLVGKLLPQLLPSALPSSVRLS